MARIVFVAGGYDACGWYRCHVPGVELEKKGHEVILTIDRHWPYLEAADIVVFQRAWAPHIVDDIEKLKALGKLILYELDDDIWNLGPANPTYEFWNRPGVRLGVVTAIKAAHKVTLSTKPLAAYVSRFNKNVHVLPNCLPDEDWEKPKRKHKKLVIGWAGSNTHWADLSLASAAVEQILDEFPEVELHVAGMFKYPFEDRSQMKVLGSVKLEGYPDLLRGFDIGLAPLTDDHFNACKSDLKFIEYGALEIAPVVSKAGAYGTVENGKTGFVAQNSKDWLKYLRRLISDDDTREEIAHNARAYAESRFISRNIWRWEEVYGL